jgi:hypothetical protein
VIPFSELIDKHGLMRKVADIRFIEAARTAEVDEDEARREQHQRPWRSRRSLSKSRATFSAYVRCSTLGGSAMTGDDGQIKAKRDAAARARRLLAGVFDEATRSRMVAFAAALEAEADALERSAQAPPAAPVTQIQMQVQQGPPAKDDDKSKP